MSHPHRAHPFRWIVAIAVLLVVIVGYGSITSKADHTGRQMELNLAADAVAATDQLKSCIEKGPQSGSPEMAGYDALIALPIRSRPLVEGTLISALSGGFNYYDGAATTLNAQAPLPQQISDDIRVFHPGINKETSLRIAHFGRSCYDQPVWEHLQQQAEAMHAWILGGRPLGAFTRSHFADHRLDFTGYRPDGHPDDLHGRSALWYLRRLHAGSPVPTPQPQAPSGAAPAPRQSAQA